LFLVLFCILSPFSLVMFFMYSLTSFGLNMSVFLLICFSWCSICLYDSMPLFFTSVTVLFIASKISREIAFLVCSFFSGASILWGRRLAWKKSRLGSFGTINVAMYHSHFSAISSLFSFFVKSLLKRSLAEGYKNGKTEHAEQRIGQMSWMWKHKELERWKTLCSIWRNSALFLQRLRSQIFRSHLVSPAIFFFFVAAWSFFS
jgi:hypothetical protein